MKESLSLDEAFLDEYGDLVWVDLPRKGIARIIDIVKTSKTLVNLVIYSICPLVTCPVPILLSDVKCRPERSLGSTTHLFDNTHICLLQYINSGATSSSSKRMMSRMSSTSSTSSTSNISSTSRILKQHELYKYIDLQVFTSFTCASSGRLSSGQWTWKGLCLLW